MPVAKRQESDWYPDTTDAMANKMKELGPRCFEILGRVYSWYCKNEIQELDIPMEKFLDLVACIGDE